MRDRRWRVHGHPHAGREGHDHRLPRGVAGRDAARLVHRERHPAGVRPGALERAVGRCARDGCRLGQGARPVRDLVAEEDRSRPGIRTARRGFAVDETFVSQTEAAVPWFDDVPSTAALYLDADGTPRDVGHRLRNRDLARTYKLIADGGARAFYRGDLAKAIVAAAQKPPIAPDGRPRLAPGAARALRPRSYEAIRRKPTRVRYRGLDVWGMAPPSSGGSTVGEVLNILEGYGDLAADRTRALHLLLESERLAYADRARVPGRPRVLRRAAARSALRQLRRPAARADQSHSGGHQPGGARRPRRHQARRPASRPPSPIPASRPPTSWCRTRRARWCRTPSPSSPPAATGSWCPGYGFLLNNELTDFEFDSTTAPNRADGKKRPRSSMSPTIVTRNGKPYIAIGSPGGSTIPGYRAPGAAGAARPERDSAAGDRAAAGGRAQHGHGNDGGARLHRVGRGPGARQHYGHTFGEPMEEIGAVTAIEFRRRGRAAGRRRADPSRRWQRRHAERP